MQLPLCKPPSCNCTHAMMQTAIHRRRVRPPYEAKGDEAAQLDHFIQRPDPKWLPTTTPYSPNLSRPPIDALSAAEIGSLDFALIRKYTARLAFLRLPYSYISAFMPTNVWLSRVGPMKWYSRYPGYVVPRVLCTACARRQSYQPSI